MHLPPFPVSYRGYSCRLFAAVVILALCPPALGGDWSGRQLDKALLEIDRNMDRGRWQRVVEDGTEALPQCIRLKTERSPACIGLLNKLNHALYHSGRFLENRARIEKAFSLAVEVLGQNHLTTRLARELYYRLLLAEERYTSAIDVLRDIIAAEKSRENDAFEIMNRTRQLYALYGLTGQYAREEDTLRSLLPMTDDLLGADTEDYRETARALAENLCSQQKYPEFFAFVREQGLDMRCQVRP